MITVVPPGIPVIFCYAPSDKTDPVERFVAYCYVVPRIGEHVSPGGGRAKIVYAVTHKFAKFPAIDENAFLQGITVHVTDDPDYEAVLDELLEDQTPPEHIPE